MRSPLLFASLALPLVALCNPIHAAPSDRKQDGWRWTFQAAGIYQFESDLDLGGTVSINRHFASLSAARQLSSNLQVGIEFGYGEDRYDFSGTAGFAALVPWKNIRETRISVPIRYFASSDWTLFAVPSLGSHAERGASLSDGQTGGLIAGAIYRMTDSFSIGPGLGVFSEIEDDTGVFPVLFIDWKISDTLSLETGGGFASSRGPGLLLNWRPSSSWRFAFGGRYEKTRFRLDSNGPAPGGVGEDKAIPIYALAEYSWSDDVKVSFIAGAEVGGNLRLENSVGALISDTDLDTAPFAGLTFKTRF